MRLRFAAVAGTLLIGAATPALAQNQGTPEQRIDRLEKQLRQVQGRVFVRGQPADTAGFVYEPAATQSSVTAVNDRLSALERQMADILRQSEENGHRLSAIEGDLAKLRSDQEQRIGALEAKVAQLSVAPPVPESATPVTTTAPKPAATGGPKPQPSTAKPSESAGPSAPEADPAEEAYSQGFRQWQNGQYDEAISSLRAFVKAYPKHRRVSYANNLIGRAFLDSNRPGPAAEAFLANYRQNENGERAQDSLYYLGQSVMKLGQPGQACKAYAELEDVYRGKIRPEIAKLLPTAKAQAGCN